MQYNIGLCCKLGERKMIRGKAKLEFGVGDIKITQALRKDGIGALCFVTQEQREIGERVDNEKSWTPNESQVIFTFSKVDSIDVLIDNLEEVKRLMNGNFDERNYYSSIDEMDFDSFLINSVKEAKYDE